MFREGSCAGRGHLGQQRPRDSFCLFFNEVKFAECKMNCFEAYNSVAFSTRVIPCGHHLCRVAKHFHHSRRNPLPKSGHLPFLASL